MRIREHARTAREFLAAADAELAAGDILQGCEKLWGAASHAVIAAAQRRVWRYGSHGAMRANARALSEEIGDAALITGFKAAERFHANFYHGFMEMDVKFDLARQSVHYFVHRVLALIDADN